MSEINTLEKIVAVLETLTKTVGMLTDTLGELKGEDLPARVWYLEREIAQLRRDVDRFDIG